jgi:aspartate/methionine/tyrosine aminotransferase
MPRAPQVSATVAGMTGSLFTKLAHRLKDLKGEVYPLHVGDTWLEPAVGCRLEDILQAEHPGLNRYAMPHGHPALLEGLEAKLGVDRERLLVTAGCTAAIAATAGTLLDPGDEVLILSPHWPLVSGIVTEARGVPVEVDFYLDVPDDVAARLASACTDRTVALYLNSPNNPTGAVLSVETLQAIAEFARERSLWIWADEVYDELVYEGEHVSIATVAPERTFVAGSFSKVYGMAGNRVGWLMGPEDGRAIHEVRKVATHTFYSASTAGQIAAARVLEQGGPWLERCRSLYAEAGANAARTLGMPVPKAGTFLFVDVSASLDERGLEGFLHRCIDQNLVLSPGISCGAMYTGHVRLCFTSAPPDVVDRGVQRFAELLCH